jgi:D-alanyl-D-alanine carboxypeptidase (penicillin-binding protein 5/6)
MFRSLRTAFAGFAALVVAQTGFAQTPSFETRATSAYVRDLTTGVVLLDKNADTPLPPASMSKLMTLLMLFDSIKDGRVSLDTTFTVSPRAHAMGGSRMFLELRDRPTALDLIRGISVLSGNDASVVVAEGLAGSEENFARLATARAREIGMMNTSVANSSGWPDPNHLFSKRDMGLLIEYIITNHPEFYPYLAEREFSWNGITQPNRVPLLGGGTGLDGGKTGFTSAAGYSLTGSAQQGDRRIVFAFGGLANETERRQEAEAIINWAFRQFALYDIAQEGTQIATAPVWLGAAPEVPLIAGASARSLVPALGPREITATVVYDSPIPAPITQGARLGELVVDIAGAGRTVVPLLAGADVAEGGFMQRAQAAAGKLAGIVRGATLGTE